MEAAMRISEEVMGHLLQMFDEMEAAITVCPDSLWRRKDQDDLMMVPAFLAGHAVWCMGRSHLLDIPRDQLPADPASGRRTRNCLRTRQQLIAVLAAIRSYTASVYGQMDNDTYLTKKGARRCLTKRGARICPISRVMYTIAHTRHHLGQLVQILKEQGITPPKWYPR
jgi:hypothetical protein